MVIISLSRIEELPLNNVKKRIVIAVQEAGNLTLFPEKFSWERLFIKVTLVLIALNHLVI